MKKRARQTASGGREATWHEALEAAELSEPSCRPTRCMISAKETTRACAARRSSSPKTSDVPVRIETSPSGEVAPRQLRMSVLSKISSALVVEDNILLAGQMREFLTELGCQETRVATTLEKALLEIDCGIQFAVLDVAIKDDGCSPLADRLETLGIPFIYFTDIGGRIFPTFRAHHGCANRPQKRSCLRRSQKPLGKAARIPNRSLQTERRHPDQVSRCRSSNNHRNRQGGGSIYVRRRCCRSSGRKGHQRRPEPSPDYLPSLLGGRCGA